LSRRQLLRCCLPSELSFLPVEQRAAAQWAVDQHVRSGCVVGLLDGPLVILATQYLGARLREGSLTNVTAWAASAASAAHAAQAGVPLVPDEANAAPRIDVLFEQPDEVEPSCGSLPYVTGRLCTPAQPELARSSALRQAAAAIVLIAPPEALTSAVFGGSVPICMEAESWEEIAEEIDDIFLGDASLWRRSLTESLTEPFGGAHPYCSADGLTIVDLSFDDGYKIDGEPVSPAEVAAALESVPGVVAHGLVVDAARVKCAIVALPGSTTPRILFPF